MANRFMSLPPYYKCDNVNLLALTVFILIIDGIAFFKIGPKSEDWRRLTIGGIIAIAILLASTILILCYDLCRICGSIKPRQRKQIVYDRIGTSEEHATNSEWSEDMKGLDSVQIEGSHSLQKKSIQSPVDKDRLSFELHRTQLCYSGRLCNYLDVVKGISKEKGQYKGVFSIV